MPTYPRVYIRTSKTVKAHWEKALREHDGSGEDLLEQALNALEKQNQAVAEGADPEEKVLLLGEALLGACRELRERSHKRESILSQTLKQNKHLEKATVAIDAMKRAHADQEAQLLGQIHDLRQGVKDLQAAREELATLKAENQALKRERLDLRKQMKAS